MTFLKYNFLFIILLISSYSFAQNTFSTSIHIPDSNDYSTEIFEHDNHYYFSTNGACFLSFPISSCFHVVKLDSTGQEVWRRKFEDLDIGLTEPSRFLINFLPNNTMLLTAAVRMSSADIYHPHLINLSLDGEVLWTKTFDNTVNTVLWQSQLLPSGNLLNFGWEQNDTGSHLVVRKIDMNGEVLFKKDLLNDCITADYTNNMSWMSDGNLIIGHYCRYDINKDYIIATKIDTLGNEIWTEYYDNMAFDVFDLQRGIVHPLPDGGYAFPWQDPIGNSTLHFKNTIFAFDSLRQPIWQLPLPEVQYLRRIDLNWVNHTANGDLVYVGTLLAESTDEIDGATCIGRISPAGEHKWIKYYLQTNDNDSPFPHPLLYYIAETSDGGLIASGRRKELNPDGPGDTTTNPWILKVDANGCMTSGCTDTIIYLQNDSVIVNTKEPIFQQATYFHLSPNPADDKTQLDFITSATNRQTIKIFSIDGQLMQQIEIDGSDQTIEVDLVDFSAGIYVVALEEEGRVLQRERLIKR